jgi:hypothetical protein
MTKASATVAKVLITIPLWEHRTFYAISGKHDTQLMVNPLTWRSRGKPAPQSDVAKG